MVHSDTDTIKFWAAFGFDITEPPACFFKCYAAESSGETCEHCCFFADNNEVINPWLNSGFWEVTPSENPLTGCHAQKITKSDGTFKIDYSTLTVDISGPPLDTIDLTIDTTPSSHSVVTFHATNTRTESYSSSGDEIDTTDFDRDNEFAADVAERIEASRKEMLAGFKRSRSFDSVGFAKVPPAKRKVFYD